MDPPTHVTSLHASIYCPQMRSSPFPPVAGSAPTQPIGGGWRDGGRDQYLNHIYDQLARRFVPKRHRDSTNWTMNWTTWKHVLPGVEKMTKDDSCTCCLIGFKVGTLSYIYIFIYLFIWFRIVCKMWEPFLSIA